MDSVERIASLKDGFEVHMYDPHVDRHPSPFHAEGVYFVATNHKEFAEPEWQFPQGSVVIDPWRYIRVHDGIEVISVGIGQNNVCSTINSLHQKDAADEQRPIARQ